MQLPFKNPDLPQEQRIDDLLKRLTIEEKIDMMQSSSKGVERLGIPDYNWWNEALHGVARAGVATVFPQAIALAASFDPEEHLRTFTIISDEARAKYNESTRQGYHAQYYGLSFWTPNINIFRDPRWGRGQETYGEDPFLTSEMGKAAVIGLQGTDDRYFKTHACAKHFAVHSGPEWNRHEFNATTSVRDLWETYLPAFKALVTEANVQEVMGAYNRFDGDPCCSNDLLLIEILRERWNYKGMVVSDCGAINDFFREGGHKTHADAAAASADAVITGTDVECGTSYATLSEALAKGIITEDDIDNAMRRVIKGWIELGMFDPADRVPWSDIPYSIVGSEKHVQQALNVARKSMVLLKNDKNILPVKPGTVKKIAVIGPNAADSTMMLGNYNGVPRRVVTILDGIKAAYPGTEITYERGCDLVEGHVAAIPRKRAQLPLSPEEPSIGSQAVVDAMNAPEAAAGSLTWMGVPIQSGLLAGAVPAPQLDPEPAITSDNYTPQALAKLAARAAEADVIFFVGGLSPQVEGEELKVTLDGFHGGDRDRIELPEIQGRVLKALHATGKPVVFILCTGSAVALAQNEGDYDALINAWYGGQEGGTALADVLTGAYNPSGRLPITFYKSTAQLPDFLDYNMKGRTYRYMTEEPLYPFGYGLSYTTFSYAKPKLSSKSIAAGSDVTVKVKVKNSGKLAGDEIVQVYVKRLGDPTAPVKSLKGFQRISLNAGEVKTLEIKLPASSFEYYSDEADDLVVKPGAYTILVGGSSADKDLTGVSLTVK